MLPDASLAEPHHRQEADLSKDSHIFLKVSNTAQWSAEPLIHSDSQQSNQTAMETLECLKVPRELSPLETVSNRTAKGRSSSYSHIHETNFPDFAFHLALCIIGITEWDMLWTSYRFSDIMGFPLLIGNLDSESRASKSAIAIPRWSPDYGCLGYTALTPIQQYLKMWLLGCNYVHVQSCPTFCNPMHCSPPDSSVHGISQARILEWVAIPFSRGSSPSRDQTTSPALAGGFFTTALPWVKVMRVGSSCWD